MACWSVQSVKAMDIFRIQNVNAAPNVAALDSSKKKRKIVIEKLKKSNKRLNKTVTPFLAFQGAGLNLPVLIQGY